MNIEQITKGLIKKQAGWYEYTTDDTVYTIKRYATGWVWYDNVVGNTTDYTDYSATRKMTLQQLCWHINRLHPTLATPKDSRQSLKTLVSEKITIKYGDELLTLDDEHRLQQVEDMVSDTAKQSHNVSSGIAWQWNTPIERPIRPIAQHIPLVAQHTPQTQIERSSTLESLKAHSAYVGIVESIIRANLSMVYDMDTDTILRLYTSYGMLYRSIVDAHIAYDECMRLLELCHMKHMARIVKVQKTRTSHNAGSVRLVIIDTANRIGKPTVSRVFKLRKDGTLPKSLYNAIAKITGFSDMDLNIGDSLWIGDYRVIITKTTKNTPTLVAPLTPGTKWRSLIKPLA